MTRSKRGSVKRQVDVIIAGGGVTGLALGYGLAKKGCRTIVLDVPPLVDRASRSNMGLIWCQSKALGHPAYARWGFLSSKLFPKLARELLELSTIDIAYVASGGIIPCLGEAEFRKRSDYLEALKAEADDGYPGEMLSRRELENMLPKIRFGNRVVGATWCDRDGFVEPLKLMFALRRSLVSLGGMFLNNHRVIDIIPDGGEYHVVTDTETLVCERLVLAGGLGNRRLANLLGFKVPIQPDRGQVLLTERIANILPIPLLGITRTPGGTVMIGFSHEKVGTDTRLVPEDVAKEGRWALEVWPAIANLKVIRCWSSLRVMPNDQFPIYDAVPGHPQVYLINAHSSVTLAAVHAEILPDFVMSNQLPADGQAFRLVRFSNNQPQ